MFPLPSIGVVRGGDRTMKRPWTRDQLATVLQGILCLVLFLVILQLWLLNATVNASLGGDEAVLWPAAVASLACCTLNVSLFRYLNVLERPRATHPLASAALANRLSRAA